jgi:hypothetical protein
MAPEVVPGIDQAKSEETNKTPEPHSSSDSDVSPPGEDELSGNSEEIGDAQG